MKATLRLSVEYQARVAQFDYNRLLPLDLREAGVEYHDGIAVHDVSYASVAPGRIEALLIVPPGQGQYPAVIFVHPGPGNRFTFLEEALLLAHHGAVSLLIDAPWSRGEAWGRALVDPASAFAEHLITAKDLRRAIDLLTTRPEVHAASIGYIGHSFGALFGGVLAGVEERIKTFVLMAGVGSFTDVAVLNLPQLRGAAQDHYHQVLMPIDPLYWVQFAAPAPLLFQFGFQDRTFARARFIEFSTAGSEPKAVKWYNADHYLRDPGARRDRLDWLQTYLGLDEPSQTRPASSGVARKMRPAAPSSL